MTMTMTMTTTTRGARGLFPLSRTTIQTLAFIFLTLATVSVAEELFDILDQNHNGVLDKTEYNDGMAKLSAFLQEPLGMTSGDSAAANAAAAAAWPEISFAGFWKAFTSSFAMILATEIGDKTFFIAAVLSMKHSRSAVFLGAVAALFIMTILSTAMGTVLPKFMPRNYTHWLSGGLFLYFGCKLLYDSRQMEKGRASDELEEVEEELALTSNKKTEDEEAGGGRSAREEKVSKGNNGGKKKAWHEIALQALTLTFVAEWGDRSQIATIALGASKNAVGVTVGGCLGHSVCTGLAVLGGRMLAARISERTVSQGGGVIFLLFGIHSLFFEE